MEQPDLSMGWSFDLLNNIFQSPVEQIHEPFESPKGMRIVKVTEKKDGHVPEFQEVKDKVREAVLKNKAKGIAKEKAQEYLQAIKTEYSSTKPEDFARAAKTLNLEIFQTPTFNRGLYLPKIGLSKDFEEAAFALSADNKISGVVETTNGFCILHLDNRVAADKEGFEKKKDELTKSLASELYNEAFTEYLNRLRLDADLVDNIAKQKDQAQ